MLESYYKLQLKPKTVPEFRDALLFIRSVLPKKAIDNDIKDYRRLLQASVSYRWTF